MYNVRDVMEISLPTVQPVQEHSAYFKINVFKFVL
jgi:hypothetical protein